MNFLSKKSRGTTTSQPGCPTSTSTIATVCYIQRHTHVLRTSIYIYRDVEEIYMCACICLRIHRGERPHTTPQAKKRPLHLGTSLDRSVDTEIEELSLPFSRVSQRFLADELSLLRTPFDSSFTQACSKANRRYYFGQCKLDREKRKGGESERICSRDCEQPA